MEVRHRRGRRIAWVLLAVIGGLGVLAAVLVRALVDTDALSQKLREKALPEATRALGRNVTAERMRVRLFPPRAEIDGLVVEGAEGEPTLVSVAHLTVWPRLLPLLLSAGKELQIRAVEVEQPVVSLVHRQDGSWSGSELARRPAGDRAGGSGKGRIEIGELSVHGGRILLEDRSGGPGPRKLELARLEATLHGLGPGSVARGQVAGAIVAGGSAGGEENLHLSWSMRGPVAKLEGLEAQLHLDWLPLGLWRELLPQSLRAAVTAGTLSAEARLKTEGQTLHLSVRGHSDGLTVHGQGSAASIAARAQAPLSRPLALRPELEQLALHAPGLELTAKGGQREDGDQTWLAVDAQRIDLNTLLGPPAPDSGEEGPRQLVPPALRQLARRLRLELALEVAEARRGKLELHGLHAKVRIDRGQVRLETATLRVFDGQLELSGSSLDLTRALPRWTLKGRARGWNMEQLELAMGHNAPIPGTGTGFLDAEGSGNDWPTLRQALVGAGQGDLENGAIRDLHLTRKLKGPVRQMLRVVGGDTLDKVEEAGNDGTAITHAHAEVVLRNGRAVISRPVVYRGPEIAGTLTGSVGLDTTLALEGTVEIAPDEVERLAGKAFRPDHPLKMPLKVSGRIKVPVAHVSPGAIAGGLVEGTRDALKNGVEALGEKLRAQGRPAQAPERRTQ